MLFFGSDMPQASSRPACTRWPRFVRFSAIASSILFFRGCGGGGRLGSIVPGTSCFKGMWRGTGAKQVTKTAMPPRQPGWRFARLKSAVLV